MRAAVYTRISQDAAGERLGVTRQLDDCLALADQLGWDVTNRFDDNDTSAFSGKTRAGFEAMLDAMKRGEVDALICWHPDRLYRTLKDLVRLLEVAAGVEIRTVNGGDIDLSTSTGRMLATILGSVAAQESEHHAERRKAANLQRAVAGEWCATGNRTYGYDKTGVPLEPEASLLRQAAADILAGRSLGSIVTEWNSKGFTTTKGAAWSNLHLRRVLMNPRIAALRVHQGKIVGAGNWEPILDPDNFRGLTAYLSDPSRTNGLAFERKHQGSGIYRCGICDQPMYATYPHGRGKPMTYACRPTSHVARRGAPLDYLVEQAVLNYLSGTKIHTLLDKDNKVDVKELQAKHEALQSRLDELADELTDMLTRGEIDRRQYSRQYSRGTTDLQSQLDHIESQVGQLTRKSPSTELVAKARGRRDKLEKLWHALTPDLKGKVVDELMTVTVNPAPRGRKGFDPECVDIKPKGREQ